MFVSSSWRHARSRRCSVSHISSLRSRSDASKSVTMKTRATLSVRREYLYYIYLIFLAKLEFCQNEHLLKMHECIFKQIKICYIARVTGNLLFTCERIFKINSVLSEISPYKHFTNFDLFYYIIDLFSVLIYLKPL